MAQKKDGEQYGFTVRNRNFKKDMNAVAFYDNGRLPIYSDLIDHLVDVLIERTTVSHYQNIIVIEGRTGSGKSTLALQIIYAMAKKLGIEFNLKENYVYDTIDLATKLQKAETDGIRGICPITFIDEGTVMASSKNAMKADDKKLIVMLQLMRSLNWTTVICVPQFKNLNSDIREQLTDFRIRCPEHPLISRAIIDGEEVKLSARGFFQLYEPSYPSFSERSNARVWWKELGAGIYAPLEKTLDEEYQKIKTDSQFKWMKANYLDKLTQQQPEEEENTESDQPKKKKKATKKKEPVQKRKYTHKDTEYWEKHSQECSKAFTERWAALKSAKNPWDEE